MGYKGKKIKSITVSLEYFRDTCVNESDGF